LTRPEPPAPEELKRTTLRAPTYTRGWESDPLGISRRSQDGIRSNLLETTLASQDAFLRQPRLKYEDPWPKVPTQPDQFWSWNLVLTTLLSQDATLAGDQWFQRFDPKEYQFVRSWNQNLVSNTLAGQDALLVGDQVFERAAPKAPYEYDRAWWQNLVAPTLAGQDASLASDEWFARPQPLSPPVSWAAANLLGATLGQVISPPAGSQWCELPKPAAQPDRFYQQNLVLGTLTGQDASLVGDQSSARPQPSTFQPSWSSPNLLGTTLGGGIVSLPPGDQWCELPKSSLQPDRFYQQNLVLGALAGQDAALAGAQIFFLPVAYQTAYQPVRGGFYTRTVITPGIAPAVVPVGNQWFTLPAAAQWPYWSSLPGSTAYPRSRRPCPLGLNYSICHSRDNGPSGLGRCRTAT
jgi:hypothetical protein